MLQPLSNFYRRLTNEQLILLFTLLSMAIAWRVNYIQHGAVNNDFVLYHEAARLFTLGEWKQGFAVFSWPLFSLLIAGLHKLTFLDLHLSAQIITTILFSIASYSFLRIITLAGGNKTTLVCGILILLSNNYLTGDVLPMLLRDPGAWAFFLTSLVFFIQFYRNFNFKDAILWQASAIVATLFRVEYISFLIFLPLIFFIHPTFSLKSRILLMLKAQSLNILILLTALISLATIPSLTIKDFGRIQEVLGLFDHKFDEMLTVFSQRSNIMAKDVLQGHFDGLAKFGLLAALVSMCIVKCINTLGWVNMGLLVWKRKELTYIKHDAKQILIFSAVLSILNIAFILMSVFLLVHRYTAPLALILMVFTAFALASVIKQLQIDKSSQRKIKWCLIFIILFMSLSLLKICLPKRDGYNYAQDAVAWVKLNNIENKPVFYDDSRMRYYADAPFTSAFGETDGVLNTYISDQSIHQYEYLLVNYSASKPEHAITLIKMLPQYREIKRFNSYKNKKSILILKKFSE